LVDAGGIRIEVTLIDEWAVSDERKTVKEATENTQLIISLLVKENNKKV
jgi:hypothetical protein